MQILHECRDSRDDHFAKRNIERRAEARRAAQQNTRNHNCDDAEFDEAEILAHLKKIDDSWSEKKSRTSDTVNDCLKSAKQSGLINDDRPCNVPPDIESLSFHQLRIDNTIERVWEEEYSHRRKWNPISSEKLISRNEQESIPFLTRASVGIVNNNSLPSNQDDVDQNGNNPDHFTGLPSASVALQQPRIFQPDATTIGLDPQMIADKWSLNEKQTIAYHLIIDQSLRSNPEPLSLIITGAAGTGKSRIIHAAQDFLEQKNQAYRFRLSSFTGIAAQNIEGVTLHSALSLSAFKGSQMSAKTREALVQRWSNVDFLFVDEYSMIGCQLLYKIHLALTFAKECSKPFGGINIIFAGDFAQLPAVGETRLYANFRRKRSTHKAGANLHAASGKLLWLSISNVIILQRVERQRGSGADTLISLLGRLREGKCTKQDYTFLCSRIAKNVATQEDISKWNNAPIIVSENATKDALNVAAAEAFAKQTGRHLYWYYCTDTHDGQTITDPDLRQHLLSMTSNNTGHRLGRIPLVIGMPVMITTNFDVSNGIVNGRIGVLKSVNYWVDDDGNRHATSCIVESSGITGPTLSGLDENQAVALQDVVEMLFVHPHSKKKCKIKRTQLPIQPAFSITAYKSQGMSLDQVVVDLESCSGSESPYVMISRVKSLNGLLILRPFRISKITCNMGEDVREELKRQRLLELVTLARHGDGDLARNASANLHKLNLGELLEEDETILNLEHCNLETLVRREDRIGNQVERLTRDIPTTMRKRPLDMSHSVATSSGERTTEKRQRLDKTASKCVNGILLILTAFQAKAQRFIRKRNRRRRKKTKHSGSTHSDNTYQQTDWTSKTVTSRMWLHEGHPFFSCDVTSRSTPKRSPQQRSCPKRRRMVTDDTVIQFLLSTVPNSCRLSWSCNQ